MLGDFTGVPSLVSLTGARALVSSKSAHVLMIREDLVKPARATGGGGPIIGPSLVSGGT